MAVMLAHPPDMRPPSPALTDPDMILPFDPTLPDTDSSTTQSARKPTSELTPPTTSRPTLPGAWLSDEELPAHAKFANNSLQPNTPLLPFKSPIGRFLHTIDPKLRPGIGVDTVQYSPSIYSPTESTSRTPVAADEEEYEQPHFPALLDEKVPSEGDDDEYDDIMGAKAEQILANAKQKLLAMESNLNRARTLSLGTSNEEATAITPAQKLPMRLQKSMNGASSHLRVSSDTKVINDKPAHDPKIRSASAMDAPKPFGSFVHQHHHLEPLEEDDLMASSPTTEIEQPRPSMKDLQEQMTNLKGKINSLKERTREDTLRRRSLQALKAPSPFTDADVVAPSPYLEHMRPASNSSDRSAEFLGDRHSPESASLQGEELVTNYSVNATRAEDEEDSPARQTFPDRNSEEGENRQGNRRSVIITSARNIDITSPLSEKAIFDHVDENNASQATNLTGGVRTGEPDSMIPSSPTYQTDFLNPSLPPIHSPAHEDRPDAFDYETYVLNSTMGSFSRAGFHTRSNSSTSAGSTSTQRPSYNHLDVPLRSRASGRPAHGRNDSIDSTSTTATFATAATGGTGEGASRANSRMNQRRAGLPHTENSFGPSRPLLKSSYTSLRQALATSLNLPTPSWKRNSFSPLPSPSRGAFPLPAESSYVSLTDARQQILSLLLRTATQPQSVFTKVHGQADPEAEVDRCWAPEDEQLVGTVVDGLIKVIGRVVRGENDGGAGRSILDSIGAVLQK